MSADGALTPAVLRERASRARAFARYLPAYDEAVERLLGFAAGLEGRADALERQGGCTPAQPSVGNRPLVTAVDGLSPAASAPHRQG
jgi:hypothetical protein